MIAVLLALIRSPGHAHVFFTNIINTMLFYVPRNNYFIVIVIVIIAELLPTN